MEHVEYIFLLVSQEFGRFEVCQLTYDGYIEETQLNQDIKEVMDHYVYVMGIHFDLGNIIYP